MKTFKISYDGYASRFKNLNEKVEAETAREAVETFYANKLPDKYFPDNQGSVYDEEDDLVADEYSDDFYYDGGYFRATDVDGYVPEYFNSEAALKEEMSEAFSYKDENGNIVFPRWQVIALMREYARLACEAQKVSCAVNAKIHYKCENESWSESELSGRNHDGRWEVYTVDEDSIINTRNILEL